MKVSLGILHEYQTSAGRRQDRDDDRERIAEAEPYARWSKRARCGAVGCEREGQSSEVEVRECLGTEAHPRGDFAHPRGDLLEQPCAGNRRVEETRGDRAISMGVEEGDSEVAV